MTEPTLAGLLVFTVNRLEYLFNRLVEHTLRELNLPITPEEAQTLVFARIFANSSVSDLAASLMRDRTTATRLVGSLEAKGYVQRVQDHHDRRVQRVHVTPEGEAALALYVPLVKGRVDAIASEFDQAEIQVALRVLRAFQAGIVAELVLMGDEPPVDPTETLPPPRP